MIDGRPVKCLLLDLDDTLLANSWRVYPSVFARMFNVLRTEVGTVRALRAMKSLNRARFSSNVMSVNHIRFMEAFKEAAGISAERCQGVFNDVFLAILNDCRHFFSPIASAKAFLSQMAPNVPIVLATNPVFTEECTNLRVEWAGLEVSDFKFITHSQNMHHCKPSPGYYEEILARLQTEGITAEDCLFIGNDRINDGAAIHSGITTVLAVPNASQFRVLRRDEAKQTSLYQASWKEISQLFL